MLTKNDEHFLDLLERMYGDGAGNGHIEIEARDFYSGLKKIGMNSPSDMAKRMYELTILVSGGD